MTFDRGGAQMGRGVQMRGGAVPMRGRGVRMRGGAVRMRGGGVRMRGGLMHQDMPVAAAADDGDDDDDRDDDDRSDDYENEQERPDDDDVQPDEWVNKEFNWVPAGDQYEPERHAFTGQSGIQVDTTNFSALQYFELFFNGDFVNHLVIQTNLYAAQYLDANPNLPPYSDARRWQPTNPREMKEFIGLMLLMGIIHKPYTDLYWSLDNLYDTPIFRQTMPRLRFRLLLRFLHFNDNTNAPNARDPDRDRLFKVRPLLDHFFEMFQNIYVPEGDISIDESLLLWKGRLLFRQYIPMKRARFGIKVFCLCETSGYTFRFKVYCGKEDPFLEMDGLLPDCVLGFSKAERTVLYLAHPLLDAGYTIYMDNYYTTPRLFAYLHSRSTMACGTLRLNKVPREIRQTNVPQDGMIVRRAGSLLLIKFKDKKDVHMLTTAQDGSAQMVRVRGRRGRGAPVQQKMKPTAVIAYNANMGGVDKQDQMLQPYSAARKSLKWYRKLGIHVIQVALLNAHILYQKDGGRNPFLRFCHDVSEIFLFYLLFIT